MSGVQSVEGRIGESVGSGLCLLVSRQIGTYFSNLGMVRK